MEPFQNSDDLYQHFAKNKKNQTGAMDTTSHEGTISQKEIDNLKIDLNGGGVNSVEEFLKRYF